MRVLQVVKTTDGARWAAWQAQALTRLGIQVDVALPAMQGEAVRLWRASGAHIHLADFTLPLRRPWLWHTRRQELKQLLDEARPDLIHTHFVTNALALRLLLGRNHSIPILFEVPGPLHLESPLSRRLDLGTAGRQDYWIASSRYTRALYLSSGVSPASVFLSYYGVPLDRVSCTRTGQLRAQLGLGPDALVVGNINHIYPPKYHLGQTIGLKGHEYVIDALARVCGARRDVTGVLVGGQWGGGHAYRDALLKRARQRAGDRIQFVERVGFESVNHLWADYDCAVHLPTSENCGGVVEPLAAEVPTIASRVGGLPEVVIPGLTGWLVPPRAPEQAAECILQVLEQRAQAVQRAYAGRAVVLEMFSIERVACEVAHIYRYILGQETATPRVFDSAQLAVQVAERAARQALNARERGA